MSGNTWANGCRGKVFYPSRRRAAAAIRSLQRSDHVIAPETLMPYPCRECTGWHIGHSSRPRLPAPLRRVRAAAGDVVEITWRMPDGTDRVEQRTVPTTEGP